MYAKSRNKYISWRYVSFNLFLIWIYFPANNVTCSPSESNWSMMGAVVSIFNAFISIVIIILLLSMCICYFSRKNKEYQDRVDTLP